MNHLCRGCLWSPLKVNRCGKSLGGAYGLLLPWNYHESWDVKGDDQKVAASSPIQLTQLKIFQWKLVRLNFQLILSLPTFLNGKTNPLLVAEPRWALWPWCPYWSMRVLEEWWPKAVGKPKIQAEYHRNRNRPWYVDIQLGDVFFRRCSHTFGRVEQTPRTYLGGYDHHGCRIIRMIIQAASKWLVLLYVKWLSSSKFQHATRFITLWNQGTKRVFNSLNIHKANRQIVVYGWDKSL